MRISRCSDGHVYVASPLTDVFASVHLGTRRYQRCPVDHKWRIAQRVDPASLTDAERESLRSAGERG